MAWRIPDAGVAFEATVKACELGTAVLHAAEKVLAEYGEERYAEEWVKAPFPVARIEQLRAAMNPLRRNERGHSGPGRTRKLLRH